ncbi:hypothetical protein GCM10022403_087010 [Streptomyces coacervatus]|uniref:Uncharacterized protein n=1 Tax=Streptomyces coacervatus TaxID=647381 RepID=A0ABP7JDY8_9ACTN
MMMVPVGAAELSEAKRFVDTPVAGEPASRAATAFPVVTCESVAALVPAGAPHPTASISGTASRIARRRIKEPLHLSGECGVICVRRRAVGRRA